LRQTLRAVLLISFTFLAYSCGKTEGSAPSSSLAYGPTITNINDLSIKSDAVNTNISYSVTDVDSTLNCNTAITVSSSNTGVLPNADISKSGTAPNCVITINPSLNVAGTSTVTVSVSDGVLSANDTFNVSIVNVTSLSVQASSLTLAASATSQLSATASYSDSSTQVVTTSTGASWSSSNPAVATVDNASSKGLVSAAAAGSTNVSATYKGVTSNNSAVTVISATSVTVSVGAVSGGVGSQRFISATAQNSSTSFDVTNTAAWSSSNASVASVSNGVITFNSAGSTVITVTYAGLSATVNVTVQSKSLVSIAVTGGASGVAVNGTVDLVATATYSDSSTEVVTNSAVWSSSNTSVISVSNTLPNVGRITGLAAGSSTISAVIGSISGSQLVNVNAVTISSIAITPYDALVTSNGSYSLRAIATYSDASTSDVTDLATWASSNSAAATVSDAAGSKGVATTPNVAGYATTNITATLNSVVGTTPFGVNGSTISNILVTPIVTITPTSIYQLRAYANLADGGTVDVTSFAVWSSSSVSNVTVSNSVGSKGSVTGITDGASTITATFNSVNGTRTVTVAGSSSLTEVGTGLLGTYYTWTGSPPPAAPFVLANQKGQRIDARINYAWGSGTAPMGVGDQFAVLWTGFYKAISATNYFCTNSDDGVRVWINGVQVINNWTEHGPTWDCTANIALTVGTKYAVVIEYYENGGGSQIHFTRSSTSAADAQNTTTRAIPQNDLFHQ
jgi:trimeric autotransporter adhesin